MQKNIQFTSRQEQVFSLLIEGKTYQEIANKLGIKRNTVKSHLRRIYKMLGVHGAVEAFRKAMRLGIFPRE